MDDPAHGAFGASDTLHLLERARAGDKGALDAVYLRHQGRLLAFVRARMHPALAQRVAAEDLVQETLLESSRKIEDFEPRGPSAFYRWLVEIARFKMAEASRAFQAKKRAAESPLDAEPAAEATSASGRAMTRERGTLLKEAVDGLPDDQAEAVRLRYLEGLGVAETAERLGRSPAAVKALVSRGLLGLAERLAGGRAGIREP